jgi:hypothetical protein
MIARQRLPNRRDSLVFEFEHRGLRFTASLSRYPDGRIGELFVQNHKNNSGSDVAVRDSAVLTSLALQYGCSLEILQRAVLRDPNGAAASPIGTAIDIAIKLDSRGAP